jgi:hypothetical protein
MTVEAMLIIGFLAGFLVGLVFANPKAGCGVLLIVPIAMFVYIGMWQSLHSESIRSTSALDFIFGPLWPSIAAIAGFVVVRAAREFFRGGR